MRAKAIENPAVAPMWVDDGHEHRTWPDGVVDLTRILIRPGDLDKQWSCLACSIATTLRAESCWLVFLDDVGSDDVTVRVHGNREADMSADPRQTVDDDSGLADATSLARTMSCGVAARSAEAVRPGVVFDSRVIVTPIWLEDSAVGMIYIKGGKTSLAFNESHLDMARLVALSIGQSLHLARLHGILNSRFAQLTLMDCSPVNRIDAVREVVRHSRGTVRLLARSFYRELTKAGLGYSEIVAAAAEIISQLSCSLKAERAVDATADVPPQASAR